MSVEVSGRVLACPREKEREVEKEKSIKTDRHRQKEIIISWPESYIINYFPEHLKCILKNNSGL